MPSWFRLFRVRSPLLAESLLFSLPLGTEMVHFPRFAPTVLFIQTVVHEFCSCGFPHSEICGSKDACSSPQLIAACHVLHRLEVPRHPPCALSSLTIKFTHEQQIPPSISDLRFKAEVCSPLRNLVTYLVLYCACTVKLALCVSLLSDITRLIFQISNFRFEFLQRDVGQQSLFDCQRSLSNTFDGLLMAYQNFNIQIGGLRR